MSDVQKFDNGVEIENGSVRVPFNHPTWRHGRTAHEDRLAVTPYGENGGGNAYLHSQLSKELCDQLGIPVFVNPPASEEEDEVGIQPQDRHAPVVDEEDPVDELPDEQNKLNDPEPNKVDGGA